MIGYAPLDPVDEPTLLKPPPPLKVKQVSNSMAQTECNYLVMFFIVGVLGLALKDMLRK